MKTTLDLDDALLIENGFLSALIQFFRMRH